MPTTKNRKTSRLLLIGLLGTILSVWSPVDVLMQTPPITPQPTVSPLIGPIVGPDYRVIRPTVEPTTMPTSEPTTMPQPQDIEPTPAPTLTGTPMPFIDTANVGIQTLAFVTQDDWNTVMLQVDDQLQLGWIKLQVSWDFYQPNSPDEISEDLRRLEIFVEQISQQRGVNVLLSVAKAPSWSRASADGDGPPDDPAALANFITLLLNEFGYAVDAVEVWNEPNLRREWNGQSMDGATYMRYFDAGYQAVRAYSPDMTIVTAGLAPTVDTEYSRDDRTYLQEMYRAGLANYGDVAIGVHPYGWGNAPDTRCCFVDDERGWDDHPHFFFLDTIEDYRAIALANGHDRPLWLTEMGWATWEGLPGDAPDLWMTYNSKWDQANYGLRAIQIAQELPYVETLFLWNLNFAQPILIEQRDERVAYSLVLPEGTPRERPFYWMLYDAVQPDISLDGYD